MYQVIARKYRPQTFDDLVNQEHVKQTLRNALELNRVGHGYIFSGQRGTGKTTMARIVAKALNCQQGMGPRPCLRCASCLEIAAGNSLDLVEIDAASNRRIDDIRELRESVRYRPVRDRHKVFIIDEAHQITVDAFNALLKTLEEPPEWVVFMLCTTEPQAIPPTISSRCQTFQFRAVEVDDVAGRLRWICGQEGIEADEDALVSIALAGDGSIRDSLSTLDQAIACFGKKLESGPVRDLLGAIPAEITGRITRAVAEQDAGAMLEVVDRLVSEGRHLQHFCGELTRYFRNMMVMKVSGADTRLVAAGPSDRKRLAESAEAFSQDDLSRYVQLLLNLYRDLQHAPQPRFRLEIGLLKLVYAGRLTSIEQLLAGGGGVGAGVVKTASAASRPAVGAKPAAAPRAEPRAAAPKPASQPARAEASSRRVESPPEPVAAVAAPPAGGDATLREKLVLALRQDGDDFTADAIEHSLVTVSGNQVEIRAPLDFELSLQMAVSHVEALAARLLGASARVKLGSALDDTESMQTRSAPVETANNGSAVPEPKGEAAERALSDPEVAKFRAAFPDGNIREVRDLREYSS